MDPRRMSAQARYQAKLHSKDSASSRKWNEKQVGAGKRAATWRGAKRVRLVRERDPDPYAGQDVRRSE
jgi:hypothetical protein